MARRRATPRNADGIPGRTRSARARGRPAGQRHPLAGRNEKGPLCALCSGPGGLRLGSSCGGRGLRCRGDLVPETEDSIPTPTSLRDAPSSSSTELARRARSICRRDRRIRSIKRSVGTPDYPACGPFQIATAQVRLLQRAIAAPPGDWTNELLPGDRSMRLPSLACFRHCPHARADGAAGYFQATWITPMPRQSGRSRARSGSRLSSARDATRTWTSPGGRSCCAYQDTVEPTVDRRGPHHRAASARSARCVQCT